jgi:hypothetical protein
MPFGFDPLEAEKTINEVHDIVSRVYLDVTVDCLPDGRMIPLSFTWEDGREYKIGKVINMRKGHSLKIFASGFRYLCQNGQRRYYLHYDGERWYIETKK